jgi:hypothetical protein
MKLVDSTLLAVLRDPLSMRQLSQEEWTLLVRQGRAAGLLGRLGARVIEHDIQAAIPVPAWRHMRAMLSIADKQRRAVLWEVKQLSRGLIEVDAPILLLKGAAYAAAGLAPAAGRTFSDIDIMAPKAALPEIEKYLMLSGWVSEKLDEYDQRYYRKWMHELPPMTHLRRGTNLDLHHNILPETARIQTRPDLILAASQPLPGFPNIYIPSSVDQVLHSATHLYHEGEWEHGLRDLSDLDCLLRAYSSQPNFWHDLIARARELNLTGPLGHALSHTRALLSTPMPETIARFGNSGGLRGKLMDSVFVNGMASAHPSMRRPGTGLAQLLLYVRSHWLRMPLRLLVPHLAHKAMSGNKKGQSDSLSQKA